MKYEADAPSREIRPSGNRIGVPRSLCFDEFRVFFDGLLESHGFEIVVSPPSNQKTLRMGLEKCIDEVCFPLKAFYGHVEQLVAMGLDTILVPRLVSLAKGRNLCPKFHVLPDLIEAAFPALNVLAPYVDLHHAKKATLETHMRDVCKPMLVELGVWGPESPKRLEDAWRLQGEQVHSHAETEGDITIAVLGHLYAERDPFLGVGVARHLKKLGARVVHAPEGLEDVSGDLEQDMYYEPVVRTARAIEHSLANGVDGIVLLTYFACGPDSYSAETFLYRLKEMPIKVPVLRLILDEQTSAEGLMTRLSTFLDVARHRRSRGGDQC